MCRWGVCRKPLSLAPDLDGRTPGAPAGISRWATLGSSMRHVGPGTCLLGPVAQAALSCGTSCAGPLGVRRNAITQHLPPGTLADGHNARAPCARLREGCTSPGLYGRRQLVLQRALPRQPGPAPTMPCPDAPLTKAPAHGGSSQCQSGNPPIRVWVTLDDGTVGAAWSHPEHLPGGSRRMNSVTGIRPITAARACSMPSGM